MAIIKGRYVATVIFDFETDADKTGVFSYQNIHDMVVGGALTESIRESLYEDFAIGKSVIDVIQTYADVYRVEED